MAGSSEQTLLKDKAERRRAVLKRRTAAHAHHGALAGESIASQGAALILALPGRIVGAYLPIRGEIDVLPLVTRLVAAGRITALPVIEGRERPLIFRAWRPGELLEDKPFGLGEPPASAAAVLPDILIVPLAAFDSAGYRLGYGGGYYDRTLALYRATRRVTAIGAAFDEQEVASLPRGAHDQPLDMILTPSGLREPGA